MIKKENPNSDSYWDHLKQVFPAIQFKLALSGCCDSVAKLKNPRNYVQAKSAKL